MKIYQLKRPRVIKEEQSPYLFHATFTKHVPGILKKGLRQFETSNWIKGEGGKRYNEDAGIFAFEHPEDALKWAMKMEWEFKDPEISIIRIKHTDDKWGPDPSEDYNLQFGKGQSMRSQTNVPAKDIVAVFPLKDFGNAGPRNMTLDDWLEETTQKMLA